MDRPCAYCGDDFDEADLCLSPEGDDICMPCMQEYFPNELESDSEYFCEHCGEAIGYDQLTYDDDGNECCYDCYNDSINKEEDESNDE